MTDGIPQPRPAPDDPPANGADRASESADPWWWDTAMRALRDRAATNHPFSVDDLRDDYGITDPHHSGQWGALFRVAAIDGVIERVGYERSRKGSRSGGYRLVWRGTREHRERYLQAATDAWPGGAGG